MKPKIPEGLQYQGSKLEHAAQTANRKPSKLRVGYHSIPALEISRTLEEMSEIAIEDLLDEAEGEAQPGE